MLDGERVALYAELTIAKELQGKALLTCSTVVARYFGCVSDSICATLEADEALDSAAKLEQELIARDLRSNPFDSSMYDQERSEIQREIRHQHGIFAKKRRIIEIRKSVDPQISETVEAFMDDQGCAGEDPIRPRNFIEWTCRLAPAELDRLEYEVRHHRNPLASSDHPPANVSEIDFHSLLQLLSMEIDLSRQYIDNVGKIDARVSEVCRENAEFKHREKILQDKMVAGYLRQESLSEKLAELQRDIAAFGNQDLILKALFTLRSRLLVKLKRVQVKIIDGRDQFRAALDAKHIELVSLLRDAITRGVPPTADEGEGQRIAKKKQQLIVEIVGEWYDKWRSKICEQAWKELAESMEKAHITLSEFLEGKGTIKEILGKLKPGFSSWWDLVACVDPPKQNNARLRRLLQQRFSEIYNRQYLPLRAARSS